MVRSKFFLTIINTLAIFIIFVVAHAKDSSEEPPRLMIFYSASCHACFEVKNGVMPEIEKKFKGRVIFEYRDIFNIENYKLLLSLQEKHGIKPKHTVPVCYFEGHFLSGKEEIRKGLDSLIAGSLNNPFVIAGLDLPAVDLLARFRGLRPFAIISAGLIDGVNPCAFTVIVFFVSFLALQGYIKRELIAIGLCFIFAVFMAYLLIGLGTFSFLYRINKFWLIARIINYTIGVFSIILGILAVYDFFKFKKTGKAEGLLLQLPMAVKNQIHKVIGSHYRVNKPLGGTGFKRPLFSLVLSALITGFLVSLLEAVCTGQTYLPTITFILKTTPLKLQASGYLLLYNLMFIMPLLLVFCFALFGVSSEQFSKFFKRQLLFIKILMAVLFFALGVFLIWRA